MRDITRTVKRVGTLVLCAGIAAGIALAVGVAQGNSGGSGIPNRTASAASSSRVAASVPAEISTAYSFLATSSVAMPPSLADGVAGPGGGYGVNSALGREAGSFATQSVWLVPGTLGSCEQLGSGGGACGPNASVTSQGIWIELKPVSGAAPVFYGVAPDGTSVTSDDSSASISQSGNAYEVRSRSSDQAHFEVRVPGQSLVDLSIPADSGQPQTP